MHHLEQTDGRSTAVELAQESHLENIRPEPFGPSPTTQVASSTILTKHLLQASSGHAARLVPVEIRMEVS